MSLGEMLVYLVVAFVCGLAGQYLAGRKVGGRFASLLVGLTGAVVGSMLARALGAPEPFRVVLGGHVLPILWSIVGAAVVTFGVVFLRRKTADSGSAP
jgi:uncharacterized membrane protein YeaQ/YmgE (transglycosylase-associated protein family)